MSEKILRHDGQAGFQEVSVGVTTSAGTADSGKLVALDGQGRLDSTVMPTGIGADTVTITASENLSSGDWVNIYNNAGSANVRKADASAGQAKQAHGFVKTAATTGNPAIVYLEGSNDAVTGLTPGNQFLSASNPGKATATPTTTAGHIVQKIGVATSATNCNFEGFPPITLS